MIVPNRNVGRTSSCGCQGACRCGSCDSTSCVPCEEGGFLRPQFFAGQLLTEEDLAALLDYTLEKARLRNRNLFGEGVVCGLQVHCHPCKPSFVTVQPGHAIDCCGDDVVINCPQDVDILELYREMRLKSGRAVDCGDPCAEFDADGKDESTNGEPHRSGDGDERTYCLYARYCETPAEFVTPYATEDACGPLTCQPTRIQEGFRFELRCEKKPKPGDLLANLMACLGDAKQASAIKASIKRIYEEAERRLAAKEAATTIEFKPDRDVEWILAAEDRLAKLSEKLQAADVSERDVADAVEHLKQTSFTIARFRVVADRGELTDEQLEMSEPAVAKSLKTLDATAKVLADRQLVKKLPQEYDRLVAETLLERSIPLLHAAPAERKLKDVEVLADRQVTGRKLDDWFFDATLALKNWLLKRIEQAHQLTECTLYCEVQAISLDAKAPPQALAMAALKLILLLIRFLLQCACQAVNPPCGGCQDNDAGVLLACLTMKDCKVTSICNATRQFVLSPKAVRYWFYPLRRFEALLESLCCATPAKLRRDPEGILHTLLSAGRSDASSLSHRLAPVRDMVADDARILERKQATAIEGMAELGDLLGISDLVFKDAPAAWSRAGEHALPGAFRFGRLTPAPDELAAESSESGTPAAPAGAQAEDAAERKKLLERLGQLEREVRELRSSAPKKKASRKAAKRKPAKKKSTPKKKAQ